MLTMAVIQLTLFLQSRQMATYLMVIRPLAAIMEQPITDPTGISDALIALARIGVGILAGFLTAFLVVCGYQYMTTDESTRGSHLKRGLGTLLGGAILVLVAITLAPQLVNAIVTGTTPAPTSVPDTNGGVNYL